MVKLSVPVEVERSNTLGQNSEVSDCLRIWLIVDFGLFVDCCLSNLAALDFQKKQYVISKAKENRKSVITQESVLFHFCCHRWMGRLMNPFFDAGAIYP